MLGEHSSDAQPCLFSDVFVSGGLPCSSGFLVEELVLVEFLEIEFPGVGQAEVTAAGPNFGNLAECKPFFIKVYSLRTLSIMP